jgi:hypothetical protein
VPQLSFARVHSYVGRDFGISVPVVLRSRAVSTDLLASVDTGASHCLFETGYAADLGLDLTSGVMTRFRTANSTFEAYGHEVEVEVLGIITHTLVYFFADPSVRKNVLGRGGWLDRVRLGLIDYDRRLYLAPYDHADND